MKIITVNGVSFTDFGPNNYSKGMSLISIYPMPENIVEDVLAGKYPNVWLNPSAPCTSEFYGVYGTEEQYKEFYEDQKNVVIAKQVFDTWKRVKSEIEDNYKDWWAK